MSIPQRIKAVIFDVDGVIIDSEPAWEKSHDEFIKRYRLDVSETYKATFRGIGLKELILQLKEKFQIEKAVEELIKEYREIFYANFFHSEELLLPGVEGCIKAFADGGFELAVASGGHSSETLEQILKQFNLLKYFPVVVSSDEVQRGKPDPEVFLHTAEKMQRAPAECLVIEDSVNGVLAGKAAGMLVYGVNSEEKLYNDIKAAGADVLFHSLVEIHL